MSRSANALKTVESLTCVKPDSRRISLSGKRREIKPLFTNVISSSLSDSVKSRGRPGPGAGSNTLFLISSRSENGLLYITRRGGVETCGSGA